MECGIFRILLKHVSDHLCFFNLHACTFKRIGITRLLIRLINTNRIDTNQIISVFISWSENDSFFCWKNFYGPSSCIFDSHFNYLFCLQSFTAIIHNTKSLSRHEQVCLIRLRLERYFSHKPDDEKSISPNVA